MKKAELLNRSAMEEKTASTAEMITVLHIFSGDLWAGAEVMVFHLLKELKKNPRMKIIALSLNEGVLTEKLQNANIETYVFSETEHSFAAILSKASRALGGKKIDVIHSHRYKENLLAFFLAKRNGVKCLVATLHGLSEPPLQGKIGKPVGLKTKADYFLLKYFFTYVVAVSQEIKQVLVQKYGFRREKIHVVYNGIPLQTAPPLHNHSVDPLFHIGTVGRMVPVKDFDLFLKVAAELRKQTDQVRFSILGDGPLKEALVRKARELELEDCVAFLPPRPDPVPDFYQTLDLYLNTSLHEGIPLSVLEAMSCGRPVVAPRVGGIPEIMSHGEHGFLVEGRDPKEFAQGCLGLLQDKKRSAVMGENAFKRISTCFSNSRMAASYLELYRPRDRRSAVGRGR